MKQIPLTQGKFALVDDEDYEYLNQWKWHWNYPGYAIGFKDGKAIKMHQLLMNPNKKFFIDHKNNNGLDNRRLNLRICTRHQNGANRTKSTNPSRSIYKGVTKFKNCKSWRTQINFKGKITYIGSFKEERHAALCYDLWAKDMFGEFAKTNFR